MQITYLESVDSTQTYLKNLIQKNKVILPHAVVSNIQTNGLGSRDNTWSGYDGNLFLSFAITLETIPTDLKLESASIYFAYILKETMRELNSTVLLKWPNDFYIKNKKIGGMITNIVKDTLICGVGINLKNSSNEFGVLDIDITKEKLLSCYFKNLENKFSWKQVFSKYKLEFYSNKEFNTHNNNYKFLLSDADLQDDGSLIINGERIYSRR